MLAVTSLAQTVYVPSSHWVYDYLDRMEAKRVTSVVLAGTKPMTRLEIAGHLEQIDLQRDVLSKTEIEQLDYLMTEFQEHISKKSSHKTRLKKITKLSCTKNWWPNWLYPQGRHLVEINNGPLSIHIDPIIYRSRMFADDDTLSQRERLNKDTNGFLLWGTVGQYVGYYTDIRDTREWGTRAYPSGNTTDEGLGFVQGNGEQIYHDETLAYLLFSHNYLNIQFGKDSNVWGPGYRGQLFLSDYATSYDQLKLQLVLDRFKYTYVLAWLKHYTPDYFKGNPVTKMMASHRLEFSTHPIIDIGLHSGVIYADREFEPAYANPVMFFRSAEHYLGDTDNAVMGLDVELKAVKNTKLYGELFLDDLTTSKLGSGFYGNKYGVTAGLFYVDVLGVSNLDLRAEYTAIRPFVYSHKDTVTTYAHFVTPLGHWLGPNAQQTNFTLAYRPQRRILIELALHDVKHGANSPHKNIGADAWRPHDPAVDPVNIRFLEGVRETSHSVSAFLQYEIFRNAFIAGRYNFYQRNSDWPTYGGTSPGNRNDFLIQISFNY